MTLDLKNKVFSNLTVLQIDTSKSTAGKRYWECQCMCGKIISVLTCNLQSGNTKSCGCLKFKQPNNFKDLTGQSFGKLTVINKITSPGKQKWVSYWKCKCSCGNLTIVKRSHLIMAKIISCGSCGKYTSKSRSLAHGGSGYPIKKHKSILHILIRHNKKHTLWIKLSLLLANNKCQITGKTESLEVHHIVSLKQLIKEYKITKENYNNFSYLLYDTSNSFIMTKELHQQFHQQYGYYNNREQLDAFIKSCCNL